MIIQKSTVLFVKPYGIIYEIKNLINNKRYIGQTTLDLDKRCYWNEKSILRNYQHNLYFIRSMNKYCFENFERKTLDFSQSQKELDEKEEYYIQRYNTLNQKFGYNLRHGGSNGKHTKETILKMSENHLDTSGRNNHMYGKHHSEETKNKISETKKGKNKYIFTIEYLIDQYWISEYNMKNRIININQKNMNEISIEKNCSYTTIRRNLIEYNIIIRNKFEAQKLRRLKKSF